MTKALVRGSALPGAPTGAVAGLVTSVLAVRPLVEGLGGSVRVVPLDREGEPPSRPVSGRAAADVARLLDSAARCAGIELRLVDDAPDLRVFERVVSRRLAVADLAASAVPLPTDEAALDRLVEQAADRGFDRIFGREVVASHDGLPLTVYGAGPDDGEVAVVVPACGMPAALAESWMRFLARDRRVLTWESRGLFGPADGLGEFAVDTGSQARDLFTVMDHHGVHRAHLVGMCGGAVVALAAAAADPDRVASASLWHGAYQLGEGSPRTPFQNDLIELMAVAAGSREAARSIQDVFWKVALTNTPAEVAHLVLYPYTDPDLFYRYCRLNGTLARTDVGQYLGAVHQPTLVVTSEDDVTAHPEGSRRLARALPRATLRVEAHGDHASLFDAGNTGLMQAAADLMDRHPA